MANMQPAPNPPFFPSVLLEVKNLTYQGSKTDLASRIFLEQMKFQPANVDGSMSQGMFREQRGAIARTFGCLQGVPLPDSVPDDVARAAICAYLGKQLLLVRAELAAASSSTAQPSIAVNLGSSSTHPAVSVAMGSSQAPQIVLSHSAAGSSRGSAREVSRLNQQFNNLIDHLQQSGVHIGDADALGKQPELPEYMTNAMRREDAAIGIVPDTITEAMSAADKRFLARLNFIYSERNISGKRFHDDVEREMQARFAADDMSIVNAEKVGGLRKRQRTREIKSQAHQDFRRLLEIRQQRYQLQRFADGNALMKREIDELKSREFLLFSQMSSSGICGEEHI